MQNLTIFIIYIAVSYSILKHVIYEVHSDALCYIKWSHRVCMYPSVRLLWRAWNSDFMNPIERKVLLNYLVDEFARGMESIIKSPGKKYCKITVNKAIFTLLAKRHGDKAIIEQTDLGMRSQTIERLILVGPLQWIKYRNNETFRKFINKKLDIKSISIKFE